MRCCSECGSKIETAYMWTWGDPSDPEPVCSACFRAAFPEWLWDLIQRVEDIMEPVYRAHSQAMHN